MFLVDSHAHLNFEAFDKDREKIIEKCQKEKILVVNVGVNYETSKKAVQIAQNFPLMFASVGLHPLNFDTGLIKIKNETEALEKEFDFEKYEKLAQNPKVVAIGEIGLDFYLRPKTKKKKEIFKEKQKALLFEELKLAKKLNLPVIFHCRLAHQDLISFLKQNQEVFPKQAVIHSFVGSEEELKEYLNFDFYIGFNGLIFKEIEGVDFPSLIKLTPLSKILIETDAPYLAPPQLKKERNEPEGVKFVAQKIAEIKNLKFEEIAQVSFENAKKLFNLPF